MDVYPTLLELTGTQPAPTQSQDGVSLVELLRDPSRTLPRDTLYWHLPHYHHSTPASAIRRGPWKLIEFFETGERQLYNLDNDSSESHDLMNTETNRAEELHTALVAWRKRMDARLPTLNPAYDPARANSLGGRAKTRRNP